MRSQLAELTTLLEQRLLRGEHLTLYGPRGSGKSTLLGELQARLQRNAIPSAYSASTNALDDITRALERAYPRVDTFGVGRRTARVRLWHAAEQTAGVLLLDHFRCDGSAMVSFLRRLHGKIAAVLAAVDVDKDEERRRMRPWRYGALSVRMPLAPRREIRRLLVDRWHSIEGRPLDANAARALLEAARGRPGWILKCVELAREQRYWREDRLLVTVLCVDTEAVVRYGTLAMVRPALISASGEQRIDQESSPTAGGSAVSGLITPKCAGR